jgi:hypothetical protein
MSIRKSIRLIKVGGRAQEDPSLAWRRSRSTASSAR